MIRHLGFGAVALIMLAASIPRLEKSLENNRWSLHVEGTVLRRDLGSIAGLEIPESHPRAGLWQGLLALAEGQPETAVSVLEDALHESPDDTMMHGLLGRAYEAQGQLREASAEWERANAWEEMIRAAERLIAQGEWTSALAVLSAAQEQLPQQVISPMARALARDDRQQEAIDLLSGAIERWLASTDRQEWLVMRGDILSDGNRWAEAIESYLQASMIAGGNLTSRAFIGLGKARYSAGQGIQAAMRDIERGIQLRPDDSSGYATAGDILRMQGQHTDADIWYEQAMRVDPGNVWLISRRAENLLEGGHTARALEVLSDGESHMPAEPHLHYLLGAVYQRQGNVDLAIRETRDAVLLDGGRNVGYMVALGRLLVQIGEVAEARSWFQAAVALDPIYQPAVDALRDAEGND